MFTQFEANLNTFAPLERSACDSSVYQGLQAACERDVQSVNGAARRVFDLHQHGGVGMG